MSEVTQGGPCEVPLVELLESVPVEARYSYTESGGLKATHSIPIGRYAHEAAKQLRANLRAPQRPAPAQGVSYERLNALASGVLALRSSAAEYRAHYEISGNMERGRNQERDEKVLQRWLIELDGGKELRECEQLRADAARYRVLRDLCCYPFANIGGSVFKSHEACDAHCDAAMKDAP